MWWILTAELSEPNTQRRSSMSLSLTVWSKDTPSWKVDIVTTLLSEMNSHSRNSHYITNDLRQQKSCSCQILLGTQVENCKCCSFSWPPTNAVWVLIPALYCKREEPFFDVLSELPSVLGLGKFSHWSTCSWHSLSQRPVLYQLY